MVRLTGHPVPEAQLTDHRLLPRLQAVKFFPPGTAQTAQHLIKFSGIWCSHDFQLLYTPLICLSPPG